MALPRDPSNSAAAETGSAAGLTSPDALGLARRVANLRARLRGWLWNRRLYPAGRPASAYGRRFTRAMARECIAELRKVAR